MRFFSTCAGVRECVCHRSGSWCYLTYTFLVGFGHHLCQSLLQISTLQEFPQQVRVRVSVDCFILLDIVVFNNTGLQTRQIEEVFCHLKHLYIQYLPFKAFIHTVPLYTCIDALQSSADESRDPLTGNLVIIRWSFLCDCHNIS